MKIRFAVINVFDFKNKKLLTAGLWLLASGIYGGVGAAFCCIPTWRGQPRFTTEKKKLGAEPRNTLTADQKSRLACDELSRVECRSHR